MKRLVVCFLFLFAFFSEAPAFPFTGQVVGAIDGDMIEILHKVKAQHILLQGIACPEKGQLYGNNAKQATSDLVFARSVMGESHGQDKYTRTLGDIFLSNGTHVNRELVAEGWCWWYQKYAPEDVILAALEAAHRPVLLDKEGRIQVAGGVIIQRRRPGGGPAQPSIPPPATPSVS